VLEGAKVGRGVLEGAQGRRGLVLEWAWGGRPLEQNILTGHDVICTPGLSSHGRSEINLPPEICGNPGNDTTKHKQTHFSFLRGLNSPLRKSYFPLRNLGATSRKRILNPYDNQQVICFYNSGVLLVHVMGGRWERAQDASKMLLNFVRGWRE